MKTILPFQRQPAPAREGYILFYVMGSLALLALFGLIALQSAGLEARSARNKMEQAQAAAHAEAGIRMVRIAVENRFGEGATLAQALNGLEVTAPDGVAFDPIDTFQIVVPDRIFGFEVTGRSEQASVTYAARFRRKELFEAGVFGDVLMATSPGVSIYGYDSREVPYPTTADSNGNATVGSNIDVSLGGSLTLDGTVVLGQDEWGTQATCSGCYGLDSIETHNINNDPLGLNNGGQLADLFARVRITNDNASNAAVRADKLTLKPNTSITFTAGDYYFTDLRTPPNTQVFIDSTDGPVRFFVDGEVYFAPDNGLSLNDPFDFQIYSSSDQRFRVQPSGDLSIFAYAPNAEIGLWPNGQMMGSFWGQRVLFKSGVNYFVDTSLQDRWYSNQLLLHARAPVRTR
jgi:hypothetical protein